MKTQLRKRGTFEKASPGAEAEGGSTSPHPSRSLESRARGYGIGGGYERAYRNRTKPADEQDESYGPLPHSGYYGAGAGSERFKRGQAGYDRELAWYVPQYGEKTSGQNSTTTHSKSRDSLE